MNKPKLILHIGHGKTGTTSLQNYLYKNAVDLLSLGYLFPTRHSPYASHILLPAGFVKNESVGIEQNQIYRKNLELVVKDFQRFWNRLLNDIQKHSPHTVILSAEQMFNDFSGVSRMPMGDFFGQYFSSVTVVAYIRSPVPDYLSRLAQRLRTANPFRIPAARSIRATIEYYQGQFPGCVQLHPFDRQQLRGGDILHDFFSRYVPQALPAIERLRSKSFNTALPWPLLRGLQRLRQLAQPDAGFASLTSRARIDWAIKDYMRLHPEQKKYDVSLQVDVEAFISRSAVDHLWLKEHYGVAFPDLDYSQIESVPSPYPADVALERILDFSSCPEGNFPLERYLGNGPKLWISRLFLFLRLHFHRISRMYLSDSWLLCKIRTLFRHLRQA